MGISATHSLCEPGLEHRHGSCCWRHRHPDCREEIPLLTGSRADYPSLHRDGGCWVGMYRVHHWVYPFHARAQLCAGVHRPRWNAGVCRLSSPERIAFEVTGEDQSSAPTTPICTLKPPRDDATPRPRPCPGIRGFPFCIYATT